MSDRVNGASRLFSARPVTSENVRIGPVSVFTAVIVLCMAVLAVLSIASAQASMTMTRRQADAVTAMYADERAAQSFYASLEAGLSAMHGAAFDAELPDTLLNEACDAARRAGGPDVDVVASPQRRSVHAEFTCSGGRVLKIDLAVLDDATLAVESWKLTSVTNEEQPAGKLWAGL